MTGGLGIDAEWGIGHWSFQGEEQRFQGPFGEIPPYTRESGYAEARRTLGPRWYAAGRSAINGETSTSREMCMKRLRLPSQRQDSW